MQVKITSIDTYAYWIDWCNWLFVRVTTDEGIHGWGEGSLHGALESVETAIQELSPLLIGEDPAGVERHWHRLYNAWRWRGGPTLMTALSAIDIALWDIEGKRLGVPVYRLLGGPYRKDIPVYASHWLPNVATEEEARAGARDAVQRGFKGFKWIPYRAEELHTNEAATIARGARLMAAAREEVGDEIEIYIECAEYLSPRTARMAAEALRPYRPAWFEEPIPFENHAEMGRLRDQLPVPIATGERLLSRWDFASLFANGGCDVVQPDVMHCGGLTEAKRIAELAEIHYVPVAPHNPGGPICTLASMHLAAAIPNFLVLEQMESERQMRDLISTRPIQMTNGCFELPDAPGLGTDLDLDVLKDHAFRPQPQQSATHTRWR